MSKSQMKQFLEGRKKLRSYFCNFFNKKLQIKTLSPNKENLISGLLDIKSNVDNAKSVYILDDNGIQITATYTAHKQIKDIGQDRSEKEYYYRAVKDGQCNITDPYLDSNGGLNVTVFKPIYSDENKLMYVLCMDMPLEEVIKISHMNVGEVFFTYFFKGVYALFAFSLMAVALLLFVKGTQSFFQHDISPEHFDIKYVFEATILLTLALAIFDLSKTLIEEEMLGWSKDNDISGPHKTMVKFLGSIIIALSIEALMLVFKFAITDPKELIYAMYMVGGVTMLLIGLAIYIKFTKLDIDK